MSIELDDYDRKIIQHLQINGRLTNQELAELVGLSTSQCSRRRILLEQKNVITGYYAQIAVNADPAQITGMIEVKIGNYNDESYRRFIYFLQNEPTVRDVYKLTGSYDYLLKVAVKNLDALVKLIGELSSANYAISSLNTSIILEKIKENHINLRD
ncbi:MULTISPECIES: Lrp/AsnC family transcriptional regulator [Acinetobacter]|uniref:Lrp/AsnC family transcriptional regulator n=1 Tax=Acinetobacter TaxID=469 RepID=UPI000D21CB56|nr:MULTISPECIES: Lrp/AsnC family transcriptional regulator [Acinetobacter]AVP33302.1 Leucine-responsive regulatory protein [Acinetobacter baumannii]MDV4273939.1 Lrp/AsnC family transcriptional regulator [Acinetobacter baumannii]MEB3797113.1 Lrp/AsnC family transcriptional regulator [Acinetobacter sp. IK24]MEB3816241.1 Lrp/AsnC family transcriptional regulator [Acinetobacter sp. IK22]MEB3835477.1 Lrp/AsnC family transcriptional regulator [Acinetobacter sp. IK23]